jgi:hypothetical protein
MVATLSAVRTRRLAQHPAGDPTIQAHLAWLLAAPGWLDEDPYRAGWLWVRTMTICENDGLGGAIYAEDFPRLDPRAVGYPAEGFGTFFDVAWHLLQWQAPDGSWGTGFNGSPHSADPWRSHLYALQTLQSWVVGFSPDTDDDGLVDNDDNCPAHPNPAQADEDEDGVGDLCDVCPAHPDRAQADTDDDRIGDLCDNCTDAPNPDQADADADGLGDVCDPVPEAPRPEICNERDDDQDGAIDEGCAVDATLRDAAVDAGVDAIVDAAPEAVDQAVVDQTVAPLDQGGPADAALDAALPDRGPPERDRRARRQTGCGQGSSHPKADGLMWWLALGWLRRRCAPTPR